MPTTTTTRFDHTNCKHARTGSEGKKARAACRKEHAKPAADKKVVTKKVATPRARKAKVATVPAIESADLVDTDI